MTFWATLKIIPFWSVKTAETTYWATYETIWAFFNFNI